MNDCARVYADLHGPAFQAYYCTPCAQALRAREVAYKMADERDAEIMGRFVRLAFNAETRPRRMMLLSGLAGFDRTPRPGEMADDLRHAAAMEESKVDTVFVVQGEHYSVPGRPLSVHSTRALAYTRALELVNIILEDLLLRRATDWREGLARIRKVLQVDEADVWIIETPVDGIGSSVVDDSMPRPVIPRSDV